jgi:cytidylate kinase
MKPVPVIAIDGPAASGKGAVAQEVAQRLGFHYLDSGAIYRAAALAIDQAGKDASSPDLKEADAVAIAEKMDLKFNDGMVFLGDLDVTQLIRSEACGMKASKIAVLPQLRRALLDLQRAFRRPPGLVAEGRDMGTVVFPDATLKIFLTAGVAVRAERRHKQLMEKGINATIRDLRKDIDSRDERDKQRNVAPLRTDSDTKIIDTTALTLPESVEAVLKLYALCAVNQT